MRWSPSLEPFDDFTAQARAAGLALLRPTDAQLQHGFELHRGSLVIDSFAFAPYVDPPDLLEQLQSAVAASLSRSEIDDLVLELRVMSALRFPACRTKYLQAFEAAGVAAHVQTTGGGEGVVSTLRSSVARFLEVCVEMSGQMGQARSGADIRRLYDRGEHAMVFSINGPVLGVPDHADARDFRGLRMFRQLGVRFMHLCYNIRNLVADGCVEDENRGLSDFGRQVVREMQRLGIVVDLSHCGYRSAVEAAQRADRPVVVTHSACRALHVHDRCVPDEVIQTVANTGGYIGIASIPPFLGQAANLRTYLDHVDHVVKRVGPDHVAVGTDTQYNEGPLKGEARRLVDQVRAADRAAQTNPAKPRWRPDDPVLKDSNSDELKRSLAWTNWPLITVGLVQRGYKDVDIQKIIGQNVLRVLDAAGDDVAPPVDARASHENQPCGAAS